MKAKDGRDLAREFDRALETYLQATSKVQQESEVMLTAGFHWALVNQCRATTRLANVGARYILSRLAAGQAV